GELLTPFLRETRLIERIQSRQNLLRRRGMRGQSYPGPRLREDRVDRMQAQATPRAECVVGDRVCRDGRPVHRLRARLAAGLLMELPGFVGDAHGGLARRVAADVVFPRLDGACRVLELEAAVAHPVER